MNRKSEREKFSVTFFPLAQQRNAPRGTLTVMSFRARMLITILLAFTHKELVRERETETDTETLG